MKSMIKVTIILIVITFVSCAGGSADYAPEAVADDPLYESANSEAKEERNYDYKDNTQELDKVFYNGKPNANGSVDAKKDNGYVHTTAAKVFGDTSKVFIRTADLKFKVLKVSESTYAIEDAVRKFSGYVSYTDLRSNISYTNQRMVAKDTVEETTHYRVTNDMVIRIPYTELDTCLKEIAKEIDFLDHRLVEADDITLDLLSKELEEKRKKRYDERLQRSIDKKGKKLQHIGNAERQLDEVQRQKDAAYIAQLRLKDEVLYSTITLHFYQRPAFRTERHVVPQTTSYEPNMGEKFIKSVKHGWEILAAFFLILIRYWSVYLMLGLLGWIIFKIVKTFNQK